MTMRTFTSKAASYAFMALMLVGGLSACKSKKKAAEAAKPPSGETEVKVLCSGPEFFTDEKNFRANNLGESMDQATAKKKALSNARADMASAIGEIFDELQRAGVIVPNHERTGLGVRSRYFLAKAQVKVGNHVETFYSLLQRDLQGGRVLQRSRGLYD